MSRGVTWLVDVRTAFCRPTVYFPVNVDWSSWIRLTKVSVWIARESWLWCHWARRFERVCCHFKPCFLLVDDLPLGLFISPKFPFSCLTLVQFSCSSQASIMLIEFPLFIISLCMSDFSLLRSCLCKSAISLLGEKLESIFFWKKKVREKMKSVKIRIDNVCGRYSVNFV